MTFFEFLFWIVAALAGLSAIMVVVTQNIVRAAVWLLFTLAGTAGVYFLLGSDFIGATQLIVYVGGTLVLVIFGVMLTAQGPFISMKTGGGEWALSLLVGLGMYAALAVATLNTAWPNVSEPTLDSSSSASVAQLGQALTGIPYATPDLPVTNMPAGKDFIRERMSYLLPFEIISVHLLVVLIAAAYLARAKRRQTQGVAGI